MTGKQSSMATSKELESVSDYYDFREGERLAAEEVKYIPKDGEIVIELPKPHAGQQQIFDEGYKYRFNAVRCGRRFGKTVMLISLAVTSVVERFRLPNNPLKFVSGRVGIFTPSYKQGQEIWDELIRIFSPIILWKNRSERRLFLRTGGRIDLWHLENNNLAGRGRKYHLVLLDEAAFTRNGIMLKEIWPMAIRPTLMDYRGGAWVFSTPFGDDPENFFFSVCNDPKMGFKEHHAPTSSNPAIPASEIENFEKTMSPRVFKQEVLAEFVNFSDGSWFDMNKWKVEVSRDEATGEPTFDYAAVPTPLDVIFVVSDTGLKGGTENDGHGFIYFGYKRNPRYVPTQYRTSIDAIDKSNDIPPGQLIILDWDLTQVTGAFFEKYLPRVFDRGVELASKHRPIYGFKGIYMEGAAMGAIVTQKSAAGVLDIRGHNGRPYATVTAIDSGLVARGKDDRAYNVGTYHERGWCKCSEEAFKKVTDFKEHTRNHLVGQVSEFVLQDKNAYNREDDLLDCYCYGLLLAFEEVRFNKDV